MVLPWGGGEVAGGFHRYRCVDRCVGADSAPPPISAQNQRSGTKLFVSVKKCVCSREREPVTVGMCVRVAPACVHADTCVHMLTMVHLWGVRFRGQTSTPKSKRGTKRCGTGNPNPSSALHLCRCPSIIFGCGAGCESELSIFTTPLREAFLGR